VVARGGLAMTPGVEVRVGGLCGGFITGSGRGTQGMVGDQWRVCGEAGRWVATSGAGGEEGSQERRRRSPVGKKESRGEGVWQGRSARGEEEVRRGKRVSQGRVQFAHSPYCATGCAIGDPLI
jgi:hypothetical protein